MSIVSSYSLSSYRQEFKTEHLLHLLRRTLFGVGHKELSFFKEKNLNECLDILLKQSAPPTIPLQADPDITDPLVPNGETWVTAPYENDNIEKGRRQALRAWWMGQLI